MKRIKQFLLILTISIAIPVSAQDDNLLLSRDFWEAKPTLAQVKDAVASGADPSQMNDNNFDPVVWSILTDAPKEIMDYLMAQEGNEVNKLTHDGRTYIFWAASSGNLPLVKKFGENGAKMDIEDDHGYTVLNFAANAGVKNQELYDYLISIGSDPKSEKNNSGANALLLLIPSLDGFELVDYFESKGLSLNDTDDYGNGAFNYAARAGNISMMNKLIDKGVSYKSKNDNGGNAMFFAAQGSRRSSNSIDVFEYLEEIGVAPNVTRNDGTNPFHVLANRNDDLEIFNFFLDHGVDPTAKDNEGNTPLLNAAGRSNLEIIKLFAKKTNDINYANEEGQTASSLAVEGNSPEVVKYFLKEGANAKITDAQGNTLVYYLVNSYHPRNAEGFEQKLAILKDEGVDFSQTQGSEENFLTMAVKKNSLPLIEKALETDIDVNTKDAEGNTPLQIAALRADNTKILKLLLEHGADKEVTTDFGESIFDLANENEILRASNTNLEFLKS